MYFLIYLQKVEEEEEREEGQCTERCITACSGDASLVCCPPASIEFIGDVKQNFIKVRAPDDYYRLHEYAGNFFKLSADHGLIITILVPKSMFD